MRRWTAIVADEDADCAASIEKTLMRMQYDVICVGDAAALDAEARRQDGGLLVPALDLPGFDAAGFCGSVHSKTRSAQVILLLERYTPARVAAAFEAGADDVLVKPLLDAESNARLRRATQMIELEYNRRTTEGEGALLAEIAARARFHSRRYLEAQLGGEIARSKRFAQGLALIIAEIGTVQCDERSVRELGELLAEQLRSRIDWVARYSERSFAAVLPGTTLGGALRAAHRVHTRLTDEQLTAPAVREPLELHFGVSAFDPASSLTALDSASFLECAAAYLRDAARKGPNEISAGPVPHS